MIRDLFAAFWFACLCASVTFVVVAAAVEVSERRARRIARNLGAKR